MIPTWISVVGVVVTVLSPLLALGGVLLGSYLTRKSDRELDTWRHREETMRMVRWAVEQILEGEDAGTAGTVPLLRGRTAGADGAPLVYLCRGMVCERPVASVQEVRDRLSSGRR